MIIESLVTTFELVILYPLTPSVVPKLVTVPIAWCVNLHKLLLITVIIELLIALLFKTKKYYVIIVTNIITNTLLQFAMFKNSSILLFIMFEIIIFISEYFIYLRYIDIDKKKLLTYTLLANIITMLITFIV